MLNIIKIKRIHYNKCISALKRPLFQGKYYSREGTLQNDQCARILGRKYVIGKRKQQGSSNFAPRKTFPLEGYLFCDDQSAFSIPLGINEKKALNSNFTKVKSHFTHFTDLLLSFYIRKKFKKNLWKNSAMIFWKYYIQAKFNLKCKTDASNETRNHIW